MCVIVRLSPVVMQLVTAIDQEIRYCLNDLQYSCLYGLEFRFIY